ncbi:MAG: hypothetical protein Q8L28_00480, partial [bacterium]|nr:hypothetical protein [bacterium]
MKKTLKKFPFKKIVFWSSLLIDLVAIPVLIYTIIFSGKIYPNINVSNSSLSKMTPQEASQMLSQKTVLPQKIKLTHQDQSFELPTKDVALSYDFNASSQRAYEYTRTGNIFFDI